MNAVDVANMESDSTELALASVQAERIHLKAGNLEVFCQTNPKGQVLLGHNCKVLINGKELAVRRLEFIMDIEEVVSVKLDFYPTMGE